MPEQFCDDKLDEELLGMAIESTSCAYINPDMLAQPLRASDMYLKELKAYKAPPVKPTDAEGQVQKFSMPKAPASPEEADIANDLKAYEDQVPEVEGQAVAGSAAPPEQDWFEDPEEDTEVPPGATH
ncbi:ATP synthase F0 subcomplex subunit H atp14 [Elasticomyces elasticus]|nr:ATP synthase F0 subcomplex subunit H atp14 [Elasticomyces elasticus]KAK3668356.1 ATP synthase F0 subcomplex subunit H atp14 [Elasticomyces elasticus]KAK4930954.1 ATP synthase F0 subcomplex subunit H atp14 [Elasticomyces elasticus]KAK5758634.1 ATP synthase F0 subcomplex subunit H atp14 [Elasticomyces elasticus]